MSVLSPSLWMVCTEGPLAGLTGQSPRPDHLCPARMGLGSGMPHVSITKSSAISPQQDSSWPNQVGSSGWDKEKRRPGWQLEKAQHGGVQVSPRRASWAMARGPGGSGRAWPRGRAQEFSETPDLGAQFGSDGTSCCDIHTMPHLLPLCSPLFLGFRQRQPLLFCRSRLHLPASGWLGRRAQPCLLPPPSPFWKLFGLSPSLGHLCVHQRQADGGVMFPLSLAYCGPSKSETRSL